MAIALRHRRRARRHPGFSPFLLVVLALTVLGAHYLELLPLPQSLSGALPVLPEWRECPEPGHVAYPKKGAQSCLQRSSAAFDRCRGGMSKNCVVDGDTIKLEGIKIRIADIDTPEIFSPQCENEAALGHKATARLLQLVNQGPFEMHAWPERDEDRHGRKLRVLVRDGRSLGAILVAEGLARQWDGARRGWCV